MESLILGCQLVPLGGFLTLLLLGHRERAISRISLVIDAVLGSFILTLLLTWSIHGFSETKFEWVSLFRQGEYQFTLNYFFDRIGATYLLCTWVIFSAILKYCRYYLHREPDYRRFFLTIFAFVFGLITVILSGDLDMLFAGWEIVGVSSFLLIAFYKQRSQPIRNALRAYSIYRLCDIGLLLAALLIDLLLRENNRFEHIGIALELIDKQGNEWALAGLSFLLILAATGKSAQFPFCFWIPRAMEGPTPSSAIFYGALSVHLGVFLLLRTEGIWRHHWLPATTVFLIGAATVLIATVAEQTQSNIKGKIAYASIAQVGLMFIELAIGFGGLVLLHVLGNAFLRCYQLLISPSIVADLLRVEGETDMPLDLKRMNLMQSLPSGLREILPYTLRNTLQVLSLQEFNLETWVRQIFWDSFKRVGSAVSKIHPLVLGAMILVPGLVGPFLIYSERLAPVSLAPWTLTLMFGCALLGFTHKRSPTKIWNYVGLSSLLAGISAGLVSGGNWDYAILFGCGILPAWLTGLGLISLMNWRTDFRSNPYLYRAMEERHPLAAWLFFLSFLAMVGFPFWPSFFGQDLILFHLSGEHAWMAPFVTISLVLNGISASGVYMRMCAGRPVEIRTPE